MTDQTNKKLDVVRGLLAKAESTTSEHEAEACRAKAMQLIAKYGIDEALLATEDPRLRRVGDVTFEAHAPFAAEKVALWTAVSIPLGIRSVQRKEWRDGGYYRASRSDRQVVRIHAFGRSGDLERAQLLYTSLLLQQATEFARVQYYSVEENGQDKAAFRRSWLISYANRIYQRLEAVIASAVRENPGGAGAALVLVERDEEVNDALAEAYPKTKRAPRRKLSGAGWASGYDAANRADLGGDTHVDSGRRGELG